LLRSGSIASLRITAMRFSCKKAAKIFVFFVKNHVHWRLSYDIMLLLVHGRIKYFRFIGLLLSIERGDLDDRRGRRRVIVASGRLCSGALRGLPTSQAIVVWNARAWTGTLTA